MNKLKVEIEKMQKGHEGTDVFFCGEQLKDIVGNNAKQAELSAKEAKEEAERLKKQLALASPYMTEFKTMFNQVQKSIVEMNSVIERMTSEEEKAKCRQAIAALAEKLKG